MRRALAALALAGGLAAAPGAGAQQQEPAQEPRALLPTPVLTVDQEDLFERSAFGQRARREIEAATAALSAENRRLEAELAEEEQRLTELRPTAEPGAFRQLAEAFDARVVEVRRTQDQKGRDLARRPDEARQEFFRAALPVLADLVRERGALAILDSRAVIISADLIDITDEAIRRLDATLGDGTGAPAPGTGPGTAPAPSPDPGPGGDGLPPAAPAAPPAEPPAAAP